MRLPAYVAYFCVLLQLALFVGCRGARPGPPRNLPSPVLSTVVGPGDIIDILVVGEKELPHEYRVQPDGSIDFPYLKRLMVAGMEPQEIATVLKDRLKEAKILQDPQLTLSVKTYASKKVNVVGQVNKPGSLPWTEGLKLVDAIALSGGFTALAEDGYVSLTRVVNARKTVTAVVDVEAITAGRQSDLLLQAGDTIKVDQRPF
jgi:protein involved in polysaccharide export with SLBB domain